MGRQALVSHAFGKKHVKNHESVSCFFKQRVDKNVSDCPTATTSQKKDSNAPANQKQSTLELIVNNADKHIPILWWGIWIWIPFLLKINMKF